MLLLDHKENPDSAILCNDYIQASPNDRYIFGINKYAEEIAKSIDIAGFIDDFTSDTSYLGKPIIRTSEIPKHSLVVSSLLGRPLTAKKILSELDIKQIDFFSFYAHSGLIKHPVPFWGDGKKDIEDNFDVYEQIHSNLHDDVSKDIFQKIVNFRYSSNLDYMNGFHDRQKEQYFEPFFKLNKKSEVFVDVGGFNGETSIEFIRRCPEYKSIYYFEPDPNNMKISKATLSNHPNISFMEYGASDKEGTAYFSSDGSVSSIDIQGSNVIKLNTIDNLIDTPVSFIKMDIEGAEISAIEGSKKIIEKYHPILAISVYHQASDLRRIPKLISSIYSDYNIFLRHYTEGVVETVMYFIPSNRITA